MCERTNETGEKTISILNYFELLIFFLNPSFQMAGLLLHFLLTTTTYSLQYQVYFFGQPQGYKTNEVNLASTHMDIASTVLCVYGGRGAEGCGMGGMKCDQEGSCYQ